MCKDTNEPPKFLF